MSLFVHPAISHADYGYRKSARDNSHFKINSGLSEQCCYGDIVKFTWSGAMLVFKSKQFLPGNFT